MNPVKTAQVELAEQEVARPRGPAKSTVEIAMRVRRRVVRAEWSVMGVLGVATLLVPVMFPYLDYLKSIMIMAFIYAMLAVSWDVIMGYAGQLSIGHVAFFAVGAYGTALIGVRVGGSAILNIALGAGIACLVGLIIGWLCLRFRGPYLMMVTLAFGEILRLAVLTFRDFSGGSQGIIGVLPIEGVNGSLLGNYYVALGLLMAMTVTMGWLGRAPIGRRMRAIREDPEKAEMMGVNTVAYKVGAFAVSALLGGLVGGFYAQYVGILNPSIFAVQYLIFPMGMVILGGAGTIFGGVVGSLLFVSVSESLSITGAVWNNILLGLVLIVVMLVIPEGFWPKFTGAVERRARRRELANAGMSERWEEPANPTTAANDQVKPGEGT